MSIYHCVTMRARERTKFQSLTAHLLEPLACCHATHFENLLRCHPFWMHKKRKFPASQPIKTHHWNAHGDLFETQHGMIGLCKGRRRKGRGMWTKCPLAKQKVSGYILLLNHFILWVFMKSIFSEPFFWWLLIGFCGSGVFKSSKSESHLSLQCRTLAASQSLTYMWFLKSIPSGFEDITEWDQ